MTKFRTGNVIKTPYGDIVIVTSCNDTYVNWISFDNESSSGSSKLANHTRNKPCYCYEITDDGNYDEYCEDCKGKGGYDVKVPGYENCLVLGRTVKEYILKSLTKNFDW